jgi:hypothetical protein
MLENDELDTVLVLGYIEKAGPATRQCDCCSGVPRSGVPRVEAFTVIPLVVVWCTPGETQTCITNGLG